MLRSRFSFGHANSRVPAKQEVALKLSQFTGNKALLLHHGRCGSTVLTRMLSAYPDVDWQGELFKRRLRSPAVIDFGSLKHTLRNHEVGGERTLFGFEIKPMHFDELRVDVDDFVAFCESLGFTHFVTLTRRNLLRKVISSRVARAMQQWHVPDSQEIHKPAVELSTLPGDPWYVTELLQRLTADSKRLQQILPAALHLVYEEHIEQNPLHGFELLRQHFGLPACAVKPGLRRINPEPVQELLANFEEVEAELQGTQFEWMLYD